MHTHSSDCLSRNELNELGCFVLTDDTHYLAACCTRVVSHGTTVVDITFAPCDADALELVRVSSPDLASADLRVSWVDSDNSRAELAPGPGWQADLPTPPDVFPDAF